MTKGTYIVMLENHNNQQIVIGKLGEFRFEKGWYFYVGSAFGPGGVLARLRHHSRISERCHWHIDYIRAKMSFCKAMYVFSEQRFEHVWSNTLESIPGLVTPVKKFGSSDCECFSHLHYYPDNTILPDIERKIQLIIKTGRIEAFKA